MAAYGEPFTIATSAARTTTGQSAAFETEPGSQLAVEVDVTAVSGTTPTLVVSIEWSHDGTTWFQADTTADALAQLTAAAKRVKEFDVKGQYARAVWTIGGTTPSFTFSITGYLNG